MPMITCPHCGARRDTPAEKIPRQKTRACCPECRQTFDFDPASLPHASGSSRPPSRTLTCPHCKLPRQLPDARQYNPQATLNCRRCKQSFRVDDEHLQPTVANHSSGLASPSKPHLAGIGSLLTDSWELFCRRGWSLLGIYLFASLLIFGPLLAAANLLPKLTAGNHLLAWSGLLLGGLYLLLGSAWMTGAMFHYTVDDRSGIITACRRACRNLWRFLWLLILLGLLITGGSLLLLIPGLIFLIWFFFSQYILAEHNIGGLAALRKSHQLVRGHWWAILGRCLLLLLISTAATALAARLPLIGSTINLLLMLLLTPFSMLYYYLIYQDLQRCPPRRTSPVSALSHSWGCIAVALSGWLLIPGALFLSSRQELQQLNLSRPSSPQELVELISEPEKTLAQLTEEQSPPVMQAAPQALSVEDYDRLLTMDSLPDSLPGFHLGPAVLSAERFWNDEQNPHMWLEVQLAELPNLSLAARRSARVRIEQVLDHSNRNQYARSHRFEDRVFEWVQIRPNQQDHPGYRGIRNVYLKQGTLPEQIRSISGQLELTLPLGIEALKLNHNDIGRAIQVAGKTLQLKTIGSNRIRLSFRGDPDQLLSIRAVDQQDQPLRDAGSVWQVDGEQNDLQQMFSGEIDSVTVLVAADSIKRSYPFEITR